LQSARGFIRRYRTQARYQGGVGDIDAARQRVHIRHGKGNKDRLVPLPKVTLDVLRRFWVTHRHPVLMFPIGMPD
jgi:integrase